MSDAQGHSAEYFGESRDYWWNSDFLALLAQRFGLARARSVLDAGCGVGHWGRVLKPYLAPDVALTGVDREPQWVAECLRRSPSPAWSYAQGDVNSLPFDDASFELVTCQTVLIHVPDPRRVLREFLRVCKPGGLVLVVEPNNLAGTVLDDTATFDAPTDELVALYDFELRCQRGKVALGEGHNSIGAQVGGYMHAVGFASVQSYLADKTSPLAAPYQSAEERAWIREVESWTEREFWIWSRQDTERYYLASGGSAEGFEAGWARAKRFALERAAQRRAGSYASGGGAMTFVVGGRKAG